jgi:hypothetical protein
VAERSKTDHVTAPRSSRELSSEHVALDDEPPVVARLVVEIRSDGTRTIARGAAIDAQRGEQVAIEARGDSPIQLAIALARALTQLPRLTARSAVRGLLARRRPK